LKQFLLALCTVKPDAELPSEFQCGWHVGVFGNTGSGKSCTVAGLIRWSVEAAAKEARSVGARFIILNSNREY
jgi:ABC-type dipeptide/oligopeptide/nickel transport system ATPase component